MAAHGGQPHALTLDVKYHGDEEVTADRQPQLVRPLLPCTSRRPRMQGRTAIMCFLTKIHHLYLCEQLLKEMIEAANSAGRPSKPSRLSVTADGLLGPPPPRPPARSFVPLNLTPHHGMVGPV